jgi:Na+-translocating ferredoxin:NAD+ oxidoreductase RnfC subunit
MIPGAIIEKEPAFRRHIRLTGSRAQRPPRVEVRRGAPQRRAALTIDVDTMCR